MARIRPPSGRHTRAWLIVLLVCLALVGCDTPRRDEIPEPDPTHSEVLDTIAATDPGERLVLTASVTSVLAHRAFVVRDADLPQNGLLVLTTARTELQAPDLVSVDGTVRHFTFESFKAPFGLPDPIPFRPFEGRKVLVAATVQSLA
jgi:hypothetical protein